MKRKDIYNENRMHSQGVFPFNIYICDLPKDLYEVGNHYHGQYEIIAVKSGCGIVYVNLERIDVEAGDFVFVPQNTIHCILQKENFEMTYETIIFEESLVFGETAVDVSTNCFIEVIKQVEYFPTHISKSHKIYDNIERCVAMIDKFSDNKGSGYELMIKSSLVEIFYHLFTAKQVGEKPKNEGAINTIRKIVLYIAEHYSEDITLEVVSMEMGYSKSRFMAVFKELMGMTFTRYLADVRLKWARVALLNSEDNITDISQNCGFDNISYFNRLFKEKFKMSPSSYRKKYKV